MRNLSIVWQRSSYILVFLFCLLTFFNYNVEAAVIVVPPGGSIQTAINSANNGDTVQLSAYTYTEEIQIISKSINLVGAGQGLTTINAPSAATHLTQSFSFGGSIGFV